MLNEATKKNFLARLRKIAGQVEGIARMVEEDRYCVGAQGGMGTMGGGMMMPPSTARSEEIEGGARITLTPHDSGQVAALQEHARHMAERMASGECPMMSMQGEAANPALTSPDDHEAHHPERGN